MLLLLLKSSGGGGGGDAPRDVAYANLTIFESPIFASSMFYFDDDIEEMF